MARTRYLVDTSVFARLTQPRVASAFEPMAAGGEVVICAPVEFELLYSARSHDDHRLMADRLLAFTNVATTDADHRRALTVQGMLAARGQHRALSLVDALVGAVAERKDLCILHYDGDFELLAAVTDQPHVWIVERGSAD